VDVGVGYAVVVGDVAAGAEMKRRKE